jgi:hypothetical protein
MKFNTEQRLPNLVVDRTDKLEPMQAKPVTDTRPPMAVRSPVVASTLKPEPIRTKLRKLKEDPRHM